VAKEVITHDDDYYPVPRALQPVAWRRGCSFGTIVYFRTGSTRVLLGLVVFGTLWFTDAKHTHGSVHEQFKSHAKTAIVQMKKCEIY
jgi:hypothetical protein